MMKLGGILVVHVDSALAVSDGKFGLTTKRYGARDRAVGSSDGGGVLAAAVEGEDTLADRVVDDSVRIGVGLDRADRLQRLEIENRDVIAAAVAGEAAAEIRRDSDAVHALRVRNVA